MRLRPPTKLLIALVLPASLACGAIGVRAFAADNQHQKSMLQSSFKIHGVRGEVSRFHEESELWRAVNLEDSLQVGTLIHLQNGSSVLLSDPRSATPSHIELSGPMATRLDDSFLRPMNTVAIDAQDADFLSAQPSNQVYSFQSAYVRVRAEVQKTLDWPTSDETIRSARVASAEPQIVLHGEAAVQESLETDEVTSIQHSKVSPAVVRFPEAGRNESQVEDRTGKILSETRQVDVGVSTKRACRGFRLIGPPANLQLASGSTAPLLFRWRYDHPEGKDEKTLATKSRTILELHSLTTGATQRFTAANNSLQMPLPNGRYQWRVVRESVREITSCSAARTIVIGAGNLGAKPIASGSLYLNDSSEKREDNHVR